MENAKSHHRSRNRLPETESNERLRIKVIEFPSVDCTVWSFIAPLNDRFRCPRERRAHWRPTGTGCIEPHRKLDFLVDDPARAVICFLDALLNPDRALGNFVDGLQ